MDTTLTEIEHYINEKLSGITDQQANLELPERIASFAVGAFILLKSIGKLRVHPLRSLSLGLSGGYLVYRGLSGKCSVCDRVGRAGEQVSPIIIESSLDVSKPRSEVYRFWRNLENLPLFMRHLNSVTELDAKRSYWEVNIPGNIANISWEAQITKEDENRYLSWRSIENSDIENAGKVEFSDLPGGGTHIDLFISYRPPAGMVGSGISRLLNPVFERMLHRDVEAFKTYIEQ
ncbi:MAG: SRPBCC family protein [Mucilaginibacter polytrichastri]|nr:SRPBCC family protein [Mucilaginibacter polytrichastri]